MGETEIKENLEEQKPPVFRTFEESLEQINVEIAKRKRKWTLNKTIRWMDYDDISQIIRAHINKKWHLYDQSRPLVKWVNTIISNQIRNLIRNNYKNYARPCLECDLAEGDNLCRFTPSGIQCSECPLYARWEKKRKPAYDTKLPLSIEDESVTISNIQDNFQDIFAQIGRLNHHLKLALKPNEWKAYDLIYIQHLSDEEAALIMGFKTREKNRAPGYKQIKNIKKSILIKAKELIYSDEIDIILH